MKKIYLLIALAAGLVSSCSMDTEPEGSLPQSETLKTPEDFTTMRNGLYSALRVSVGGDNFYTPIEVQGDEFHAVYGNSNTMGDLYRWDFTPQNDYVRTVYSNYEATISRANFILDGYAKCDMSEANGFDAAGIATANAAKGDAFFARAYCIFMLSQYFCADYEEGTADQPNSGVSYRLDYNPSPDPSTYPQRKTLNETMEQVKADLDSAEVYVTTQGEPTNYRISVDAITALRARMALAMDDYKAAADYAASIIENGPYALAEGTAEIMSMWYDFDYAQASQTGVVGNKTGNWETILQLEIGDGADQYPAGTGTFYQTMQVGANPDFVPTLTLYNLYSDNDYRKAAYFVPGNITTTTGVSGDVYFFAKFPLDTYTFYQSQTNSSVGVSEPKVFRIAEMYLIAAEGYAQAGDLQKATYYLNTLESSRIDGYADQTFTGKDDLMQEIKNERQREMAGEGTRIFDLKRWHMSMQRGEAQNPSVLLTTTPLNFSQPADANRMTWPIPKNETDLHIVQNPGY